MWLRVSRHRLVAIDSTRSDSVQLKPITHSDAFGLYIRGHEEQIVLLVKIWTRRKVSLRAFMKGWQPAKPA